MIEPARRAYDAETREKLVELFGAPERWATTTRSLVWHQADVLVPAFTGVDDLPRGRAGAASTWRSPPPSTSTGCPTARCRWRSTSTAPCTTAATTGGCRCRSCPGRARRSSASRSRTWRELIEHYYPHTGWIPLQEATLRALQREKARRGAADARRLRGGAAARSGAVSLVNELVDTLLYEGYALYPVHAGRDQERDADAVRDRLPARLRASARHAPTTTSSCAASSRAAAR